jgi:uncharacterized membrane protein
MTHARIAGWGGLALMFALSAALYTRLPATMPAHLSWHGADGEVARPIAAFKMPVLGLVAYAITRSKLVRQRAGSALDILALAVVGLFLAFHVILLRAAFDPELQAGRLALICASAFMCVFGNYLGKLRRNLWMGIRTPWTLASDEVWLRTHRFGARLFVASGALALCVVSAGAPPQIGTALHVTAAAISVLYSYLVSRELAR